MWALPFGAGFYECAKIKYKIMSKRVTQILSLTVLLLTVVGFSVLKTQLNSEKEIENDDFAKGYSKEMASVFKTDSSKMDRPSDPTIENINAINAELMALEEDVEVIEDSAKTSYYHDKFVGKKTASGELFSNKKFTAAHRSLPFGSKLRITNNANDESIIVTVNDRGPFTNGRHLDLSKSAFQAITHGKQKGTLDVKIEMLPDNYVQTKIELEQDLNEFIL